MSRKLGGSVLAAGVMSVLLVVVGRIAVAEPELDGSHEGSAALSQATATLAAERSAVLFQDVERGELVVLHGPVDLPGSSGGHGHSAHTSNEAVFPGVAEVTVPIDGFVFAFYVDIVDRHGQPLPSELLHHVNLIDPDQRELFAPISMRLAAAGKETGHKGVPPRLFGLPVHKGQRLAIHTMLHNPTDEPYESVVVRFHLRLVPESSVGPLFSVYPFWVDVQLPAGDKTFDLPPGRSSKSYEAQPAVAGRVLAISGHMHEHAITLRFENATTGETLWEAAPELDEQGGVAGVPIGRQFLHLGDPVSPGDTYRLTVEYDNPTGDVIIDGGMGSIGGIFLPSKGVEWPKVDHALELYQLDLGHYYRELRGRLEDLRATVPSDGHSQQEGNADGGGHVHN